MPNAAPDHPVRFDKVLYSARKDSAVAVFHTAQWRSSAAVVAVPARCWASSFWLHSVANTR
jgi:hypothetical protein